MGWFRWNRGSPRATRVPIELSSAVAVDEAINDNYRPHLRDRNVGERTRNVKLVLGNCDEDKFCTVFVASLSFKSKYAFELNSGHVN